jgi:hypothetical protein
VGSPSLGSQKRRLCNGRRALAIGPLHGKLCMPAGEATGMWLSNSV